MRNQDQLIFSFFNNKTNSERENIRKHLEESNDTTQQAIAKMMTQ